MCSISNALVPFVTNQFIVADVLFSEEIFYKRLLQYFGTEEKNKNIRYVTVCLQAPALSCGIPMLLPRSPSSYLHYQFCHVVELLTHSCLVFHHQNTSLLG